jgi:hypothetical protein
MGTIRDQQTGKALGTVSLLMDCTGHRYWEGQIKDGPCKRFYFVDHGVGSGVGATCEFEAVQWVMQSLEARDPFTCPDRAPLDAIQLGKH